jgi:hypothetical protein
MSFAKSGYETLTKYITPTQNQYQVSLISGTTANVSFSYLFDDLSYSIVPSMIYDNTTTMTYTIASTNNSLIQYWLNLTINSTVHIGYIRGTNTAGEALMLTFNLTNMTGHHLNVTYSFEKTGYPNITNRYLLLILPHSYVNANGTLYGLREQINAIPVTIRLIIALFIALFIVYGFSSAGEGYGLSGSAISVIATWGAMTYIGWFDGVNLWIEFYTLLILTVLSVYWLRSRL